MFNKLSSGWTVILVLCVFGFTACGDDDEDLNLPVIGTITDIAAGDDRFTTLVAALQRTGLDDALDVPSGRFTVFAPTDDAFAASGIDLATLSDDELRAVLQYHVVSGGTIFRTENIPDGRSVIGTLNPLGPSGSLPLYVTRSGDVVDVNGANVVVADIDAVNGTIHAIDALLSAPSITDRAVTDGRFTTLVAALQRTGLVDVLSGAGNFTVFAPTDDAFAAAGIDLDAVSDDDLRDLLLYHVLGASVAVGDLAGGDAFVASLSESGPSDAPLSLLVNLIEEDADNMIDAIVTINDDATVVAADNFTTNGVIHAIDQVLTQQDIVDFATKASALSSLATALTDADLVTCLQGDGPFTVFAPTNGAFAAAADVIATLSAEQVGEVLTYHVISGTNVRSDAIPESAVTVNGEMLNFSGEGNATIETTTGQSVNIAIIDVQGTNGVVHVIGTVLVPQDL